MLNKHEKHFNCNQCLFKAISCQYLTPEEFNLFAEYTTQIEFKKGETILRQNMRSTHLLFLHSGIVKFTYQTNQGKNSIMTVVSGTKLLGGANLLFKDTNVFSIVAVEDCKVCLIEIQKLKEVLVQHGNLLLSVLERSMEMFQASIFSFITLAHKQVSCRIADVLIYLWEEVYQNAPYPFTLSRKEIAEFAACSHENVINTLSRFQKEEIIDLQGKIISIKNIEALKEISKRG